MLRAIKAIVVDEDPRVRFREEEIFFSLENFDLYGSFYGVMEAIDFMSEHDVDLVLMALHFRDMDGLEVLRRIRNMEYPVDFIVVSGERRCDAVLESRRLGVVDYLVKPLDRIRLRESLFRYARYFSARTSLLGRLLDQTDVEELFRCWRKERSPRNLPKGFQRKTLEKILCELRMAVTPIAASALALRTGLSRTTCRRYLDYLRSSGRVDVDIRYRRIGRPGKLYRLMK